ncbi:hypothetical protein QBC38DRAFT_512066 [Podospora fimiseda]|uniref:Uncharacterized protein n=1 Tax=Podospora fimiseda TaxID=252190 RepID=A0AAN7BIB1_9PEZI|nr:hypothetical protein QBC38DRAFT_512066 [Podospora fimiseda]
MDFMIQPPDDNSIKRPWMQLSNLIDSHVQAFYVASEGLGYKRESLREDLQEFRIAQDPRDIDEITELLHSTKYRKLGLRICIARAVLSSIDFSGHPRETSLDRDVVALMRRFHQLHPNPSPEEEMGLSQWRMITASFLASGPGDMRDRRFPCEGLLIDFLSLFRRGPGFDPQIQDDENWRGSIRTIVVQGIEVGEKLFSHPATWAFAWHTTPVAVLTSTFNGLETDSSFGDRRTGATLITIFPGLIQAPLRDGSDESSEPTIVQAGDTGCGLAFFRGEIFPISAISSVDGRANNAYASPRYFEFERMAATSPHQIESSSSRGKKKDSRRHQSSEAALHSRGGERFYQPLRRSSTMDDPQPPGRSGTSRSLEGETPPTSSGRRRIGRHTT